jgi:trehalose/maltose transport system substrate-binding protein
MNNKETTTMALLSRRWITASALSVAAFGISFGATTAAQAAGVTVTISCGTVGADFESCKKATAAWAQKTGNTVKYFTPPQSTTDMLALYRQMFAAKSTDIDVIQIDIVWPGVIKDHLIDLTKYSKGAEKDHFPAIVANNTIDGKLLAMPFFTDAGLLYFRKDLLDKYGLKAPATWDDLSAAAKKIEDGERAAGSADFQGFVFQGKAYEGLTCDALEWIYSYGGGTIIDSSGKVTINNPQAAAALKQAGSWINTVAPQGVLNYGEEDARGTFQSGKAAFMRNWPYAWSLSQGADSPIKGKVGVSPLPHGGASTHGAATLGGWNLAVTKYSKNPDAAADLVMYLAGHDVQKDRATNASYNPTIIALYKDPEVLAANPFFGTLYEVFTSAVPRPATVTGLKYPAVSEAFWNAVHEVLSGTATPEDSLKKLEGRLNQLKRSGW